MLQAPLVDTYAALKCTRTAWTKTRLVLRDSAIAILSQSRSIRRTTGWVQFPYYHHVFPDERGGFSRQIDYLTRFGEFISLDQAVAILASGSQIGGRYFCITFDDGIRCCYDHALPVLADKKIPAAFFIVTDNTADESGGEQRVCKPLHPRLAFSNEYLTWQECRELVRAGMTIGSHTCSHRKLADADTDQVRRELEQSKQTIERKLAVPCRHFACPWGRVEKDFVLDRDVSIARQVGYQSFLTTQRGKNCSGDSPMTIKRDHVLANWHPSQLRYFLSR